MIERIKNVKHLDAIALSYGAMLLEGSINVVLVATMSLLCARYGKGIADIGIMISVRGLGILLLNYFSGRLSDMFGRKKIILLGAVCFIIFNTGMIITKDYNTALIMAFFAGLAHGLMDAPAITLLFDIFKGNTGPALSFVQVFYTSGSALTTILASVMIKNNLPFYIPFAIYFVLTLIIATIAIKTVYPATAGAVEKELNIKRFEIEPGVREAISLGLISITFAMFNGILQTWIPTFMENVKFIEKSEAVKIMSFYQIGSVIGAFIIAIILRKKHATYVMARTPILAITAATLLIFTSDKLLLTILIALIGGAMGLYFSLSVNVGGELFYKNSGASTGALGTVNILGNITIVWITSRLFDSVGIERLFLSNIFILCALLLQTIMFRKHYLKLKGGY